MVQITRRGDENFTCPHCGTQYQVTISLPARDSGSAICEVCNRVMAKWTDSAIPAYRMKMPAGEDG
jgi:transcription elongation factor Elf1